ncbi:ribosomal protein RPL24 [Besnoitia besnoiti]|uniref:Large ribosomal subunit protein uL24c n=1 Tax=Besnoitia besnoiti TaxID=94643 RepID=A0A2A9MF86_BESBE|nr:ribosomal protein RPL24 [Besnoitia besnoiti]PFH34921.1 ribosomal protein RPL24 [Besnoitia besnoiti]
MAANRALGACTTYAPQLSSLSSPLPAPFVASSTSMARSARPAFASSGSASLCTRSSSGVSSSDARRLTFCSRSPCRERPCLFRSRFSLVNSLQLPAARPSSLSSLSSSASPSSSARSSPPSACSPLSASYPQVPLCLPRSSARVAPSSLSDRLASGQPSCEKAPSSAFAANAALASPGKARLGSTYTALGAVYGHFALLQGGGAALASQQRGMKFVHPRHWILQWKIRPGDQVVVISGKYKTIRGTVLQIDKMRNGVSVSGVKEQKRVKQDDGTFIKIPGLIHVSKVMLIDQAINLPTRVALRVDDQGNVVRISKKSGLVIPWPDNEMIKFGDNRKSREFLKSKEERDAELKKEQNDTEEPVGPKDTPADVAVERTYDYHRDVATMQALRQMMTKYNRDFR